MLRSSDHTVSNNSNKCEQWISNCCYSIVNSNSTHISQNMNQNRGKFVTEAYFSWKLTLDFTWGVFIWTVEYGQLIKVFLLEQKPSNQNSHLTWIQFKWIVLAQPLPIVLHTDQLWKYSLLLLQQASDLGTTCNGDSLLDRYSVVLCKSYRKSFTTLKSRCPFRMWVETYLTSQLFIGCSWLCSKKLIRTPTWVVLRHTRTKLYPWYRLPIPQINSSVVLNLRFLVEHRSRSQHLCRCIGNINRFRVQLYT